MAQVKLNINGRTYDMACDDGQEERVSQLASYIDEKMRSISGMGAAKNELHLFMLTSLLLADEVFDLMEGNGANTQTPQQTQTVGQYENLLDDENVDQLKEIMNSFKARIDKINQELEEKVA